MDLVIRRFRDEDIDEVYAVQREAYRPLYERYRDDATSPYMESRETVFAKYRRPGTDGYVFLLDGAMVGAVRVNVRANERVARISALCVLPSCQGRGIAQQALKHIEALYPDVAMWNLDTIAQEQGNCHLYEKLGYVRTGKTEQINGQMTLVYYEKHAPSVF